MPGEAAVLELPQPTPLSSDITIIISGPPSKAIKDLRSLYNQLVAHGQKAGGKSYHSMIMDRPSTIK
jgi:hypothetical protein